MTQRPAGKPRPRRASIAPGILSMQLSQGSQRSRHGILSASPMRNREKLMAPTPHAGYPHQRRHATSIDTDQDRPPDVLYANEDPFWAFACFGMQTCLGSLSWAGNTLTHSKGRCRICSLWTSCNKLETNNKREKSKPKNKTPPAKKRKEKKTNKHWLFLLLAWQTL